MRFPLRGGFSVQSIVLFCLAVVMTVLFGTTLTSTPAHAASPGTWKDGIILYENHAYRAVADGFSTSHGLPEGTAIYLYTAPVTAAGAAAPRDAFFIYFAPGVDPPTATSAEHAVFTYHNGAFSNQRDIQTIDMAPSGTASDVASSCAVSGGLGWIICPVTVFLANAMDSLFGILAKMIAVQPLNINNSNPDNTVYIIWNMMRNVANVAFVIAFLILIYAQITSLGVSNYGMKKMIPRLVVAAILVNVSFFIAALAVDISNILGYSVQDVFNTIRENTFYMTDDTVGMTNPSAGGPDAVFNSDWTNAAIGILGGGGAIIGAFYASSSGALFLLFPLLLTLIGVVFLVVVVLAARQAIIIILIIIAPLAFVANLLPNTEKWFGKWRDLFMTMLIFFPAFSLVFGGSQLAGQIIIQNAGTNLVMALFGMAVQVAPLALTPLILKLSGGVLGKIAQITNNPNKGLIDRNKKWADARRARVRATNQGRGALADNERARFDPRKLGDAMVRKKSFRDRNLKGSTEVAELQADNRYNESSRAHEIHRNMAAATLDKEHVHNQTEKDIEDLKQDSGSGLYKRALRAEESKKRLTAAQNRTNEHFNRQSVLPSSTLRAASLDLETSKKDLESSESDVTALYAVQSANLTTPLGQAADKAQASKEHMESAQQRLEAHFDTQRREQGTRLNISHRALEASKLAAESAKADTQAYTSTLKQTVGSDLHTATVRAALSQATAQENEARLKSVLEEYKTGHTPNGASAELQGLISNIRSSQQATTIEAQRAANASKVLNEQFANAIIQDGALRTYAGGVNPQGADATMANALNTVRSAYGQAVTEARQINKHFNLSSSDRQRLALLTGTDTLTVTRDDGTSHTFTASDIYAREAAIEDQVAVGTIDQVEAIVERSGMGGDLEEFRTTIADALAKNGLGGKSLYLGGKTIDDVGRGIVTGREGIMALAVETIGKGKISPGDLASIDPIAVNRILQAAQRIQAGNIPAGVTTDPAILRANVQELSRAARQALTGDDRGHVKAAAKPWLEQAGQISDPGFVAPED